jgi:hypothetical protein
MNMKTNKYFLSYIAQFFLEREMFKEHFVEKIPTHILRLITFRKSCHLWDNVEKFSRIGQARDHNMLYARCTPDTKGYKHKLKIYVIVHVFHRKISCTKASQSNVIGLCTLPYLIVCTQCTKIITGKAMCVWCNILARSCNHCRKKQRCILCVLLRITL